MIQVVLATETVTFADNEPVTATLQLVVPRTAAPTTAGTPYALRWAWEEMKIVLSCSAQDRAVLRKFERVVDGAAQKIRINTEEYTVVRSENLTRRSWAGVDDACGIREVAFYVV